MKIVSILFLFLVISCFGMCQLPTGHYEGALSRDGSAQLIQMDFFNDQVRYTIPELGYFDVKPEEVSWNKDTLNIRFFYGNFFCFIDKKTNDITGISKGWDPKIRLHLKKQGLQTKNFTEQAIQFSNKSVLLSGVLLKPKHAAAQIPYVILIHGSGYQDRNTPYYHSLGHALANSGIGVLLYDKRGCGKSTGNWQSANFFDLAGDAATAFRFLKTRAKGSKIGFLGTSQGGWIATIAARQTKDCSFTILNVGPAVSLFDQEKHRVQYSMLADDTPMTSIDSALAYTDLYFSFVKSNTDSNWQQLKNLANTVVNKSWVQFINIPREKNDSDIVWWRKNSFDPAFYLQNMKCPVLSLFGEYDPLVPPKENAAKMDHLLKASGAPYSVVIIKGTSHDMLTFQGLNGSNWRWPAVYWQWRKQPQEFLNIIKTWVKRYGSR